MGPRGDGEQQPNVTNVNIQGVLEFAFASALYECRF
jgi:hypothetical protein